MLRDYMELVERVNKYDTLSQVQQSKFAPNMTIFLQKLKKPPVLVRISVATQRRSSL